MWDELWGDITDIPGDVSAWVNGLVQPFEGTSPALNANDPYYMNGGLSANDIADIDSPNGSGDLSKVGSANPGQNQVKANPSRSLSSGIMSALGLAGSLGRGTRGGQAHAASSAFHPSTGTMSPSNIAQSTFNFIEDKSNPLNVFKALNNEF